MLSKKEQPAAIKHSSERRIYGEHAGDNESHLTFRCLKRTRDPWPQPRRAQPHRAQPPALCSIKPPPSHSPRAPSPSDAELPLLPRRPQPGRTRTLAPGQSDPPISHIPSGKDALLLLGKPGFPLCSAGFAALVSCTIHSYTIYQSAKMEFGVWPQTESSGSFIHTCVFSEVPIYICLCGFTYTHTRTHEPPTSRPLAVLPRASGDHRCLIHKHNTYIIHICLLQRRDATGLFSVILPFPW